MLAIEEYTDDIVLRKALEDALRLFLENSREVGRPMYTNQFKGKLNTLTTLSDNDNEKIKIVRQTTKNGWNNFYALKSQSKKATNTHDRINESGDLYVEHTNKRKEGKLDGQKF